MDPYGKACLDYIAGESKAEINIESDVAEMDSFLISYFFRTYEDMPMIEKKALELVLGKILDVGSGAGSHTLKLQELNENVTALEISSGCCEVMKKRGVHKVIHSDILNYSEEKYDTILFLMNGIGICRDFDGLRILLKHVKDLLLPNGKILLDSSDLIFMFQDEDGTIEIPLIDKYYGEFPFTMTYKEEIMKDQWLYIDADNLKAISEELGFSCEILMHGEHYDYLACLKIK
jgi:SAM-dependent methyltransferase